MLHAMRSMLKASCSYECKMATKLGREGSARPTTYTLCSFGVGATRNVGIPQKDSNQPVNSLQPPQPGLGTLQIGVPPQVS